MSNPATGTTAVLSDVGARGGAQKILVHCLGLNEGESLCLFYDETTDSVAAIVIEVARQLGIAVTPFRVPIDEQRRFAATNRISQSYESALQNSRGVLTCLAGDTQATGFRRELLRKGVNEGTRFGHMPGANMYSLATAANIDYAEAAERCEQLAYAMDVGVDAELKSSIFDSFQNVVEEHVLTMKLGGPTRNPITSTGVISSNTWGNIPGGETFIAPLEDTANGTFVLNGSLNGRVCLPGEYVALEFQKGRAKVGPKSDGDLSAYFKNMIQPALDSGDHYADCLAELGVGVNPGITDLTGVTLIDEKCAGTAHIALGDNQRYGGLHGSNIHEDLITLRPTLLINGRMILHEGKYRFSSAEWYTDLEHVSLRSDFSNPASRVRRKTGVTVDTSDGFRVVRLVSAGRRGRYRISTEPDSHALRAIWEILPFSPGSITLGELRSRISQPLGRIAFQGVQTLYDHGLVSVNGPQ